VRTLDCLVSARCVSPYGADGAAKRGLENEPVPLLFTAATRKACSWDHTDEDVDRFIAGLAELIG